MDQSLVRFLADLVLAVHAAVVVFVVGGLVLILVGRLRGWRLVDSLWFRCAHLVAIAVVAAQSWLGLACPLTSLEMWLRIGGEDDAYAGGFVAHWVQRFLYYEAPQWVFTLGYTAFGMIVAATWWYLPPGSRSIPRE